MILVVGASGRLGGLITGTLLDRGEAVRALVRDAGTSARWAAAGAEVVRGDLKDMGSLRGACEGVDAVVTTANSAQRTGADTVETVDLRGNLDLVDAAAAAGVSRFVFTSALGADAASPVPFLRAKAEVEERLRGTGMGWTVLQPNVFMDVWVPAVVGPALDGRPVVVVGEGRRRHSLVAVRDVAAYAVAALTEAAAVATRQVLVLGGPEPLSWRDVVAALETELGRAVPLRSVQPGEPVGDLSPVMSGLLASLDTYDSPVDMTELSARYGVTPTPVKEILHALVSATGPASSGPSGEEAI